MLPTKNNKITIDGKGNLTMQDVYSDKVVFDIHHLHIEKLEQLGLLEQTKQQLQDIKKYYYFIKTADKVTQHDILNLRSDTYQKAYFKRYTDNTLWEAIAENEKRAAVMIGDSLSGKTRAILELIQELPNAEKTLVFQIKDSFFDTNFELPPNLEQYERILVFFDEIGDYFQRKNTNNLLKDLLRNPKLQIVATVRKGPEYAEYHGKIDGEIKRHFREIRIPDLTKSDYFSVLVQLQQKKAKFQDETYDNANIGSILMDFVTKKDRYRKIKLGKDEKKPLETTAFYILKALKILYYAANFEEQNTYKQEKMIELCQKMIEMADNTNDINILFAKFNVRQTTANNVYDFNAFFQQYFKAIQLGNRDNENYNFFTFDKEHIRIEPIYLEKIVADNYKVYEVRGDVEKYFPSQNERMEKGYFVRTYAFSKQIHAAQNYEEAAKVWADMKSVGVQGNVVSYSTLINKSPNFETALSFLEEMKSLNLKPNEISYNTLINKSPNFDTALSFLEEMKSLNLKPNEISYSTLINKSPKFETALGFLKEMKSLNLKPNEISYNTLINKSPNFETALVFLEEMKSLNLKPNEISYSTLINKSPNFETALSFLEEMKSLNLKPNEISYNTLINKSPNFDTALSFLEEMKSLKLKPNEISYSTFINKSPNFETALSFLEEMKSLNLKLDEISYNTLINKSPNFDTALGFLEEMKSLKLKPNEISYSTLINKSPNFETALSFLEEMKSLKLKPNIITYNTLLNKCKRQRFSPKSEQFEQAILLLEDMMYLRLRPQYQRRDYTLRAVVGIMRRHREAFGTWYSQQYGLHRIWKEFFRYVAEDI